MNTQLCVAMTVHNRADTTSRCLSLLDQAAEQASVELRRIIIDAGSTDGTWQMLTLCRRRADTFVQAGSDLYWAGGMRAALSEIRGERPDFILLLNDDAMLYANALETLLEDCISNEPRIVGGTFVDPSTKSYTYGGYIRAGKLRPLTFFPVHHIPGACVDAVNANAALVNGSAYEILGSFDRHYTHGLADFDYSLRARRKGISVRLSSRPIGDCPRNPVAGSWMDSSRPRRDRVRDMLSPKGLPPREWAFFCWRHGGVAGIPYIIRPWLHALRRA